MRRFQLFALIAIVGGVLAATTGLAAAAVPAPGADHATTKPGIRVVINVLANDSIAAGDKIDPSSLNINEFPNNGDLSVTSDAKLAYVPAAHFIGVDSFSYLVCSVNNVSQCGIGKVTVTVGNPAATTTTTIAPIAPVVDAGAPAPPAQAQAVTSSDPGSLPRTGSSDTLLALLGAGLCAAGLGLSRARPRGASR